mgnify:CR=1 FL=1
MTFRSLTKSLAAVAIIGAGFGTSLVVPEKAHAYEIYGSFVQLGTDYLGRGVYLDF